jgi:hypothetical protein
MNLVDEKGSAVAEFSLLALPLCFATIVATNYCLNVYFDTLMRATAISIARFASLADTTLMQAQQNTELICEKRFANLKAECQVWFDVPSSSRVNVRITYRPLPLLFLQPKEVLIDVSKSLETSK